MAQGFLQIAIFFAVLLAIMPVLGSYMARVFTGERTLLAPVLGPVEVMILRRGGPPRCLG